MKHPFENLGPERFQELVSALLARSNPDTQCFPVGQADGGRDSVVTTGTGTQTVFQVKYSRNPQEIRSRSQWVIEAIDSEKEKVEALHRDGRIDAYTIVVNVRGTAKKDSGDRDKVQSYMDSALPVPGRCWWREELDRRLEAESDLKWQYPDILTPADLLHAVAQAQGDEAERRRLNVINAFVRDQFETDKDVKFKQMDLQNDLVDLFVDVPCEPVVPSRDALQRWKRSGSFHLSRLWRSVRFRRSGRGFPIEPDVAGSMADDLALYRHMDVNIGAAEFLLHGDVQSQAPLIVLEGAPGQGKSTVVQYVAQIHRMRLLGESRTGADEIPSDLLSSPLRVPIKVDLRDFALWVGRKNPFSADPLEPVPGDWKPSLESFLSALLCDHSGGVDFAVADLVAVAEDYPVLIILDGLDEVAGVGDRESVVSEIEKAVARLEENALSLQVVATSRPAAFANSPTLSSERFVYCYLDDLRPEHVLTYANKWTAARNLSRREAFKLQRELRRRMEEPHLRELARNPMQLTILLGVMNTRGSSLPDRRTQLYDSYIQLFFDREAEKSPIVRENRELLLAIHGFVAWTIHTRAEQNSQRGSIEENDLRALLHAYLIDEDHDPGLVEDLFRGMVERVVALVSRVQGTFEFEVQPLREYFAAKYLYTTAAYSPPGREVSGTIVDRFDAMARNFFWRNVLRFYAGCYNKGELPSIVDSLQSLIDDPLFGRTEHPRELSESLLVDWVFSQSRPTLRRVVSMLVDGVGIRFVLGTRTLGRRAGPEGLALPWDAGGREIVDRAFALLEAPSSIDLETDACMLARRNAPADEVVGRWRQHIDSCSVSDKGRWVRLGLWLGALSQIDVDEFVRRWEEWDPKWGRNPMPAMAVAVGREDALAWSDRFEGECIRAILDDEVGGFGSRRSGHPTIALAQALTTSRFDVVVMSRALGASARAILGSRMELSEMCTTMRQSDNPQIAAFSQRLVDEDLADPEVGGQSLDWWDRFVAAGIEELGEGKVWARIAMTGATLPQPPERFSHLDDLFDSSESLVRRVRAARLRPGAYNWWSNQLSAATESHDVMLALALLLSWGSEDCISRVAGDISDCMDALSSEEYARLRRELGEVAALQRQLGVGSSLRGSRVHLDAMNLRVLAALEWRWAPKYAAPVLSRATESELDVETGRGFGGVYVRHVVEAGSGWEDLCEFVENWTTSITPRRMPQIFGPSDPERLAKRMPLEVARRMVDRSERYPSSLVVAAESRCRLEALANVEPVGEVAAREEWFAA